MSKARILCLALAYIIGLILPAQAQQGPALQELFQSETVFPQEKGEVQLSFFPRVMSGRDAFRQQLVAVTEYGITNAFQVQAEWVSYNRIDTARTRSGDASGIGDLEIGGRYSWMNISNSVLSAALGLDFTLPTGNERKGLGEGHFAASPSLVLAADIPAWPGAQVLTNFGAEIQEGTKLGDAEWFANFAFFVPVRSVTLTTELNLSQHETYFTPGVVWRAGNRLELGVGSPIGLNNASDDYRVVFMLTWEFDLG